MIILYFTLHFIHLFILQRSLEDVQRRRFQRVERRRDECRIETCGATDPERPITGPTSGMGRPGS